MKTCGAVLLLAFTLSLLFAVHLSSANEGDPNGVPPPNEKNSRDEDLGGAKLAPPDLGKVDEEKRGKEEGNVANGGAVIDNGVKDPNENQNGVKKKNLDEPKAEKERKEIPESESDSNTKHVVDSGGVDECDPSNRCSDEKNKFIACLRVPGKDSLDLSLLIQNKGTGPLDVNISFPIFVNIDQNTIKLKAKENKELRVSVGDASNDTTMIILKAGEGDCSLDFRNMITPSVKKDESSTGFFSYIRLSRQTSLMCFLAVAMVLGGVLWLCVKRFRRIHRHDSGPGYQKVELGLPVSTGGKKGLAGEADGWGDSWDDDWDDDDDEEAPMTPSRPVLTPSSRGLASRRSNKDGWKE